MFLFEHSLRKEAEKFVSQTVWCVDQQHQPHLEAGEELNPRSYRFQVNIIHRTESHEDCECE